MELNSPHLLFIICSSLCLKPSSEGFFYFEKESFKLFKWKDLNFEVLRMSYNNDNFRYKFGLGHVPSFQTSARPFLSSSLNVPEFSAEPLEIQFDTVTRFLIVTNTCLPSDPSRPMRFGFSRNGVKGVQDNNYVVLDNGETFEAEFKVSKVFLLSDGIYETSGSVVAGLTGIGSSHLINNWTGSAGVG